MHAAITPNAHVTRPVGLMLALGWVAALVLFWAVQPSQGLLPTIPGVVSAMSEQWSEGLAFELLTSFITSIEAIVIATFIGLGLAYLSVIPAFRPVADFIGKLRFLSLTGVILVFIATIHSSHWLKVAVLVFAIVTFLVHDMIGAIDAIPQSRFDHARTLGLSEWGVTYEVVIRGTLADAFEALRMNAAVAWMMLTMVEGLSRAEGGIGVLLLNLNKFGDWDAIMGIQILILFIGIGQDWLVKTTKRIACPYAKG